MSLFTIGIIYVIRNDTTVAKTTINQGGIFQIVSNAKHVNARAKSFAERIALVHTGSYSAASNKPTTAALTPLRMD